MTRKNRDILDIVNTYARVRSAEAQADRARTARGHLELAKIDKYERSIAKKKELQIKRQELLSREQEREDTRRQKDEEKSEKLRISQVRSAFSKNIAGIYINCHCGSAHPFSYSSCPSCGMPQYLDDLTIRTILENLESACDILENEELIADNLLKLAPTEFMGYSARRKQYLNEKAAKENSEREITRLELGNECKEEIAQIDAVISTASTKLNSLIKKEKAYRKWLVTEQKIEAIKHELSEITEQKALHETNLATYEKQLSQFRGKWAKFAVISVLVFAYTIWIWSKYIDRSTVENQAMLSFLALTSIPALIASIVYLFTLSGPEKVQALPTPTISEDELTIQLKKISTSEASAPQGILVSEIDPHLLEVISFIQKLENEFVDPLQDGVLSGEEAVEVLSQLNQIKDDATSQFEQKIEAIVDSVSEEFIPDWRDHFVATTLSERISNESDKIPHKSRKSNKLP